MKEKQVFVSKSNKGQLKWVWLSVLILLLDQLSKYLVQLVLVPYEKIEVLPLLSWVLVYNTGAAFSFLSEAGGWQRWFFVGLAAIISLYLLRELMQTNVKWLAAAYSLILGGAWGNALDRLLEGRVTDFILLHYQHYYFPAFNIADCAISIGMALWLITALKDHRAKTALTQTAE